FYLAIVIFFMGIFFD
ncbi:unnamed protein product, partial [Onchocerca ochengi]